MAAAQVRAKDVNKRFVIIIIEAIIPRRPFTAVNMLNALSRILGSPKPPSADVSIDGTVANDVSGDFCIDDMRPMRIAVIGAGASGIIAAIR